AVEDLPRYLQDGYSQVSAAMTARLEAQARQLEAQTSGFQGWALPGTTLNGAALDVARTTCRRAERRVCALHEAGQLHNPEMLPYLNRLSDLLWLLARSVEPPPDS
ncbi:MAG TPA: ATP:cob(I)alamin adenosyltransferase, partial [Bacillota bacterium]|nr:ATP:cob(I)alamin adenosyltransferase [Bacillota bacterium]